MSVVMQAIIYGAAFLLYGLLFVTLYRRNRYFSTYLLFVYNHFAILCSIILISNNPGIPLNVDMQPEGGTAFFLFYVFAIFTMLIYFFLIKLMNPAFQRRTISPFYLAILALMFCLPIISAQMRGADINRFNLYEHMPVPILFGLADMALIGLFVYSTINAATTYYRLICSLIMVAVSVMKGAEFGSFIWIIMFYFIAKRLNDETISKREITTMIATFAAAVIYKQFSYGFDNELTVILRFAMQGEIFTAITQSNIIDPMAASIAFSKYLGSFFAVDTFRTTTDFGFGHLMYFLMGEGALQMLEDNVVLSSGYPATLIYHTNYLVGAFLLNALVYFVYVFVILRLFFILLSKHHPIIFILFYKSMVLFQGEILLMGEYGLFNFKLIVAIVVILLLMLFEKIVRYGAGFQSNRGSPPVLA